MQLSGHAETQHPPPHVPTRLAASENWSLRVAGKLVYDGIRLATVRHGPDYSFRYEAVCPDCLAAPASRRAFPIAG
jgi:hypothetical protein